MKVYQPLEWTVTEAEDGWKLKDVLKRRLGLSRRLLARLKKTERGITVNGERQHVGVQVFRGDVIAVYMEEEVSDGILPEPVPFEILYEDEHLLVVNKAPGIVVHPTRGHYTGTLANGVVHYWQRQGKRYRFRPVHRLDQDTSGVLVIAKNPYAHQSIAEQMLNRQVKKQYAAVVHGVLQPAEGTVNAPIDRDPEQPSLRIVMPEGKGYPAVTRYETVRQWKRAALVHVEPETGRTHQIRVHMKHLGHPLVGDRMYGDPAKDDRLGASIARHALHAEKLTFRHPLAREEVEFAAPLPEDMLSLIHQLEKEP